MGQNKYARFARICEKARRKYRMCERKVGYDTEEAALVAGPCRTYRCPHCQKIHRSLAFVKLVNKVNRRAGLAQ